MTAIEDARAAVAQWRDVYDLTKPEVVGQRLANALDALIAEHERLTRERDSFRVRRDRAREHGDQYRLRAEHAEAEVARLSAPPTDDTREALATLLAGLQLRGTWSDNGSRGHPTAPDRAARWSISDETAYAWTDAILASDVWRNRHQEPITEKAVAVILARHVDLIQYEDKPNLDARTGTTRVDTGGLRCSCGEWEHGSVDGIRPRNLWHQHVARAALEAARHEGTSIPGPTTTATAPSAGTSTERENEDG